MTSNMFNDDEVEQLLLQVRNISNFHQLDINEKFIQFVEIAKNLSHNNNKKCAKTGLQVRYKLEQLRKAYEKGQKNCGNRQARKYYKLLDEIFGDAHKRKKIRKQVSIVKVNENIKQEDDALYLTDYFVIKEECDEAEINELLSSNNCNQTTDETMSAGTAVGIEQKTLNENVTHEINGSRVTSNAAELENTSEKDIKSLEAIKRSFTKDLVASERTLISSIKVLDKKYMRNFKQHCKNQQELLKKDSDEVEMILAEDRQEMSKIIDATLNALGNTNLLQSGNIENTNSTLNGMNEVTVKIEPESLENDDKSLETLLLHLIEQYKRKRAVLHRNLLKTHHKLLRTLTQERRTKVRQICMVHNKVAAGFMARNMQNVRNLSIDKQPHCEFFWQTLQQADNEILFFETFRMTKKTFDALCGILAPQLPPHANLKTLPTPVDKQVAIALYKLASGAKFDAVANAFGIIKNTARIYFNRVVKAILQLKNDYVQFPQTEEAILGANEFQKITNMPNIFGVISDIHFPVVPTNNLYYHFLNDKGYASIVLQSVVDHNLFFRDACIKPGSCAKRIFQESDLFQQTSRFMPNSAVAIANGVELPLMLLGDATYPLLPFLLKPYTKHVKNDEICFNYYLSAGLTVSQNAYRRLQGRWRCLSKRLDAQRDVKVEIIPSVVSACVILHNFVEKSKEKFFDSWIPMEQVNNESLASPKTLNTDIKFEKDLDAGFLRDSLKVYLNENF